MNMASESGTVDLHYRQYGQPNNNATLVLLHGLFGASSNWGTVANQLAPNYHVIAPDLRNHGRSPHADDVSYAALVKDVIALLDKLAIQHACVVGHSMGGKLAMQMAVQHPQRVTSIAVVDMAPRVYTHNFDTVFNAFASVDLEHLNSRADARKQMLEASLDDNIIAFLLQNLQKEHDTWTWRVNLTALQQNYTEITGYPDGTQRYAEKAWFIYGDQSSYVLPEYHASIYATFPNAVFCPVTGAGHWVYADQPERFMHCLDRFLVTIN